MWLILTKDAETMPGFKTKILQLAFIALFFKIFSDVDRLTIQCITFNEHKRPRENKMFAFYILFQILLLMQCHDNSNNSQNIFHGPPNISDYLILLL